MSKTTMWQVQLLLWIVMLAACTGPAEIHSSTVTATAIVQPEIAQATASPSPTATPIAMPNSSPTALPTAPADWSSQSREPFKPIPDSTHYVAVYGSQTFWHPDSYTAVALPTTDWKFGPQPWSPDGTHLVMYDQSLRTDGVLHGPVGLFSLLTGQTDLLENTSDRSGAPIWSPDGQYLFYTTGDPYGVQQGIIYSLETKQPMFAVGPIIFLKLLGWSADGTMFAYLRWQEADDVADELTLEIVNIMTQQQESYSNPFANIWAGGSWSLVDNQLLLYGQDPACVGDLLYMPLESAWFDTLDMIHVDTGEIKRIREPLLDTPMCQLGDYGMGSQPWSGDGTRLVYSLKGTLCFLTLATNIEECHKNLNEILVNAGYKRISIPSWSDDGRWIVFMLELIDVHGGLIAAIHPDGTELKITVHGTGPTVLSWSPSRLLSGIK